MPLHSCYSASTVTEIYTISDENIVHTQQGRGVHVTGVSAAYTFKLNKNIIS
jgi:hypothetical protein